MVQLAAKQGLDLRIEKRTGHKVRRAVISGTEVLEEPTDFPGPHIPIVVCDGEEIRIGRQVIRHGAIRHARDPQRVFNYFVSAQAETVGLQPKAPWLVTEKNVEEYEDEWEAANSSNPAYLPYTPDPANGGARPERIAPPVSSSGIAEGIALAAENLQATTGIYNASLGAQSNETSGKAITARQREGDTGTYVYVEKYGQAIEQTHRIISGLIPHVYDTAREMRIVGADGKEELAKINQPAGLAMEGEAGPMQNDMTVDAYDVVFEMGPSYNSQREEAREGMLAFLQASPELAPAMLDLVAKMQDWPLADEVAERLEVLLPPPVKAAMAAKNGEPPPPPSPQEQMQAQAMQRQAQLEDQKHELEVMKLNVDREKLQAELAKAQAEIRKAEIDAQARVVEAQHSTEQAHAGTATAAAKQPKPDERVDHVVAAVQELQQVVGQIVLTRCSIG
jgi:peptidyl-tRNA hydrolase